MYGHLGFDNKNLPITLDREHDQFDL